MTSIIQNKLNSTNLKIIKLWIKNIPLSNIRIHNNSNSTPYRSDLAQNHEKIYKYITEKYKNIGTLRNHLSVLQKILRLEDNEAYEDAYFFYDNYTRRLNEEIDEKKLDQKHTNKDWITQKELKDKIDELEKYKINSLQDNYKYLLLCCYYYQPPLRNTYTPLVIYKKKPRN